MTAPMTNSTRLLRATIAALGVLMVSAITTRADLVIDQENTSDETFTVTALSALGQSFTPTLNSIDFARFVISNSNAGLYKVELFEGDGFGGTLLGETAAEPVALAILPPAGEPITEDFAQPVEFDFSTAI